jgi:uncharacterized protein (TIGR00255 family)
MTAGKISLVSMTGYGSVERSNGRVALQVELRAVNGRGLDLQLRLPQEFFALELPIRNLLKDFFQRGRIELSVRRTALSKAPDGPGNSRLKENVLLGYIADIERFFTAQQLTFPGRATLAIELLRRGELFEVQESLPVEVDEEELLLDAVRAAADRLQESRKIEGTSLSVAVDQHLQMLRCDTQSLRGECQSFEADVPTRVKLRMERYQLENLDKSRLEQEVAFILERGDVSEELQRLESHLERLTAKSSIGGKELDFFCQEIGRELNTLGAKSSSSEVKHRLIAMKSELEKIREQAQNAE